MSFTATIRNYLEPDGDVKSSIQLGFTLLILYTVGLGVYRLYFSPLANFPGPKLAALTGWTEAYYELFHGEGGQFIFAYRKWHEQYGPIIRISPTEIHIQDSEFFQKLYTSSGIPDKLPMHSYRFNSPTAAFSTAAHNLHRKRRAATNPFFSKRKIASWAPAIQVHMDHLCRRLKDEYSGTAKVLPVNRMWGCLTSDAIVSLCFQKSYNFIDSPDFKSSFVEAISALVEPIHWWTQFVWVGRLLTSLPDSISLLLMPALKPVIDFNNEIASQISTVLEEASTADGQEKQEDTIFASMLDSDIPAEELSLQRLQHEAIIIVGAGLEPTMRALSVTTYYILANPEVHLRLRGELVAAIPDPDVIPGWEALEKLPYLSSCIEEGKSAVLTPIALYCLRLSHGVLQRQTRTYQNPIPYPPYLIPAHTPTSMESYSIHHDPIIFPSSQSFQPTRWHKSPLAPDGHQLSRYLVAFGRGPRACLGLQLAYAELFVGIASFFRRFDAELYETGVADVEVARDRFVPKPRRQSLGVRVLLQ